MCFVLLVLICSIVACLRWKRAAIKREADRRMERHKRLARRAREVRGV